MKISATDDFLILLSLIVSVFLVFLIAFYIEKNRIPRLHLALKDIREGDFSNGGNLILWDENRQWVTTISLVSLLSVLFFLFYFWEPINSTVIPIYYAVSSSSALFFLGLSYYFIVQLRSKSNAVLIANHNTIEKVFIWKNRIRKTVRITWNDVISFWPSEISTPSSPGDYFGIVVEGKEIRILISNKYINSGILCKWISENYPMDFFTDHTYHQLIRTGKVEPQIYFNKP